MSRPNLDPVTLRWVADHADAEAKDFAKRLTQLEDLPFSDGKVKWRERMEGIRGHAVAMRRRLRGLATREENRVSPPPPPASSGEG